MKSKLVHTAIIRPTASHDFDYGVDNSSHYPILLNCQERGKLWFSFRFKDKLLGIKFTNQGTVSKPKIKAESYHKSKPDKQSIDTLLKELDYRFQFSKDYSGFLKFEWWIPNPALGG